MSTKQAQAKAAQVTLPEPTEDGPSSSLQVSVDIVPIPGRPQSTFEIQEATEAATPNQNDNIVYPTGTKLWLSFASLLLASMCYGLDLTIVAVTVPALSNHFKSIRDIGWYQAVYGISGSGLTFFWSRCYTLFNVKWTYMASIAVFELGALLATVAQTSPAFIFARAIAGVGGCGMQTGAFIVMTHSFPNQKRPVMGSIIGTVQTGMMVSSPLIGGALIDNFTWRACFGINLPLGVITLALIFFGFRSPITNPDESLPIKQKFKKLDPIGTMIFIPAVVTLLLALQWGGLTYGWGSARIIALLVVSVVLIVVFGWWQYRLGEDAMIPPRIALNRNVLGMSWFEACCDGTLALTEMYISIYLQGVRGFSAFKSGYLGVPMIVGLSVAVLIAGAGISTIGYYTPFMLATSILTPVASGLLTTLDLETQIVKVLCLLGFIGAAIGLGISAPAAAIPTVLAMKDVPIGFGICGFLGRLLPSIFVSSSATLFQQRLASEVNQRAPGQNITTLSHAGLSEIRKVIGKEKLRDVLLGYGEAVSQTLYLPVALIALSIVGTAAMEWKSVKAKTE